MAVAPFQVLAGIVCWVLFVVAIIGGLFTGLGALLLSLVWRSKAKALQRYTSNIIHASDCACAAVLGWSGDNTVSKECGRELIAGSPCRFCSWTCAALNKVDPGHCEREGRN